MINCLRFFIEHQNFGKTRYIDYLIYITKIIIGYIIRYRRIIDGRRNQKNFSLELQ